MDIEKVIDTFNFVRDIPYGVGQYNRRDCGGHGCTEKALILFQKLEDLEIKSKIGIAQFNWHQTLDYMKIKIPNNIMKLAEKITDVNLHTYIIAEMEGKYLILDPTWDYKLKKVGFPVNCNWKGTTDTQLAVYAQKNETVETIEEFELLKLEYIQRSKCNIENMKKYYKYYTAFNLFLKLVREE